VNQLTTRLLILSVK